MVKKILWMTIFLFSMGQSQAQASSVPYISTTDLLNKYNAGEKINILIVPGHDSDFGGTVFNGVREVELNWILAGKLFEYFKNDEHFNPIITQEDGEYTEKFDKYFKKEGKEIDKWRKAKAREMKKSLSKGKIEPFESVTHAKATSTVIGRLYGINKWANENKIDLIIHVHFNDYGSRKRNAVGEYGGFAVYVPEKELLNGETSIPIGNAVHRRLGQIFFPSDFPGEASSTLAIEERDLIAIGSNNSLVAPSMLIEYSFIYEALAEKSYNGGFFTEVSDVLARQTYEGIKDFFRENNIESSSSNLNSFYKWEEDIGKEKDLNNVEISLDVLMLQIMLRKEGLYPIQGMSRGDCPLTGKFGLCTETSLKAYQEKYNIKPTGFLGPRTRTLLNLTYSR